MPIVIACPSCKAKMKAPDAAAGKAVKCPGCGAALKVPAATAAVPAPAAARAPASRPAELDHLDEIDSRDEEAPRRGRGRPQRDERLPEEREDDYDDQEEDRPRRKGRKSASEGGEETTAQERNDALIFWVLALVFSPIGPVVWWIMKKQDSRFLDHQGKQWLNLLINSFAVAVVLMVLFGILSAAAWFLMAGGAVAGAAADNPGAAVGGILGGGLVLFLIFGLFFLVMLALGTLSLVYTIIALLKAKDGVWYRIPHIFQIVK
jgi:uncharacterized Tic20 family protein